MVAANTRNIIERPSFFNGQRLFAADMQGSEAFGRNMRWMHNRSLHQPGIGSGCAVFGRKSDREVLIQPGYVLDALGREIIFAESRTVSVPPVAGTGSGGSAYFFLTVAYPDDAALNERETRVGVCLPAGAVRLSEEPQVCWVELRLDENKQFRAESALGSEIEQGLRIVLARVEVRNCRLYSDPIFAERRSARPSQLPYIACGAVLPEWKPWIVGTDSLIGIQADIDTRAAGFGSTPCYSTHLEGLRPQGIFRNGTHLDDGFYDGELFIDRATAIGFHLNVRLLNEGLSPANVGGLESDTFRFPQWSVIWFAVEG